LTTSTKTVIIILDFNRTGYLIVLPLVNSKLQMLLL